MPRKTPAPGNQRKHRSPKGILRWLVRFFALSTAVVTGILILVSVIASVLYLNRVRLLNRTLALLVAPFRVTVDDIDFYPIGVVRIENLQLSPKRAPEGAILAKIPETIVTYRLDELRTTRRLADITLRGPEIFLDDTLLAALTPDQPDVGPPSKPFLLSSLALFTGTLAIENGGLRVALAGAPPITGRWSFRTGALDFEESGLTRTPFSWSLADLVLGEGGVNGSIAAFSGEGRLSADLTRLELGSLRIDRPELKLTPDLFANRPGSETGEGAVADTTLANPPPIDREILVRGFSVSDALISLAGFDGSDGRTRLPDISLAASFSAPAFHKREGRWDSDGPLALTLGNVQAGSGGVPFLSAGSIGLTAPPLAALLEQRRITSVTVERLDLLASDETLARFLDQPDGQSAKTNGPPSPVWTLESLDLGESSVLVRNLTLGGKPAPEFSTSLRGTFRDLRFGGSEGFASGALQSLVLEQTRLRAPGAGTSAEPLLALEHTEIEGKWSEFQRDNLLERVVVRGPKIQFTDAALGSWLGGGETADPGEPRPMNRPVYKARDLEVTGGQLVADSSFGKGKVPKIRAGFSLATVPPRDNDPYSYRLRLDDFSLRNHARGLDFIGPPAPATRPSPEKPPSGITPLVEGEVFRVAGIEVDFTAAELQRTRRIGKVKLDGAVLTVGEGLKAIAGGEPEDPAPPEPTPEAARAPAAAAPANTRDLPAWNLGEVEITRSRVHFEAIVPQIEGLQFAVETRLFDVPLSLDGILAQDKLQKIELAGIEIKDPYTSFITVAELPTIFVEFSLAGLARQTVEKIDLIGPSLHVGQGLFWWVDYQRNFREQNEGASVGVETGVPAATKPDWVIRTINASSGKIIISPTGVPMGAVPFPFNATTNMSEGNIELKLNIPDEDHVYRFPDFKVEIAGLAGDVQFNVPVKDLNNNLVQTFTLRRAKWKQYDARDLYLTVTFDENGVYGKFGGAAYAGYTEGQFNFYLKDQGKWDAWVAGTDLDTGPITSILAPESFLMDGKVSLKVISEGRDKVVGKTSGEFTTSSPGWFDVTKLDAVLEKLPPEWNRLQRSLTEIGIGALKRFDYDQGAGNLSFLNREGRLDLRFEGDYGTRALNVQVHDERNKNDNTAARSGDATATKTETPVPEASARPAVPIRPAAPPRLAGARKTR